MTQAAEQKKKQTQTDGRQTEHRMWNLRNGLDGEKEMQGRAENNWTDDEDRKVKQ